MARYHFLGRAVDTYGNAKPNVDVYIYLANTTTPANIYLEQYDVSSVSGVVTTDAYGRFDFWIEEADFPDGAAQLFDITAVGLTYEDIEIMRGIKSHHALLDLNAYDDHHQYANLTQNEKVSGSWTFSNIPPSCSIVPYHNEHLTNKYYVDTENAGVHSHLDDLTDELRTLELSAGTRFYTDELLIYSVSAASREADNRQNEYLLTAVQPLSAAVDEKNRRQDEYYTTFILSVSGASREADNRQNEYLLTAVQPLSAAVNEQDNRLREYVDVLRVDVNDVRSDLLSLGTSSHGVFNDLRHRLHTHEVSAKGIFDDLTFELRALETSASSRFNTDEIGINDIRYDLLTLRTSAGGVFNDLRHRLHTHEVSAKGIFNDLTGELRSLELSAHNRFNTDEIGINDVRADLLSLGLSSHGVFNDLRHRLHTHEVSAKGIFDDLTLELRSLELSAHNRFNTDEIGINDVRHDLLAVSTSAGGVFNDLRHRFYTHVASAGVHLDSEEALVVSGFVDRDLISLGFKDSTRTVIVSAADNAPFDFYVKSNKFSSTRQTTQITDVEGRHYVYFDQNGSFQSSTVITEENFIEEYAPVSMIQWDATNKLSIMFTNERHECSITTMMHHYLHELFGARYEYGLGPYNISVDGTGDLATDAQVNIASGRFYDEDVQINTVDTISIKIPVLYRSGTVWRKQQPTGFPVISFVGGSGRLAYNLDTGGTWSQAEVGNTDHVLAHIFATNALRDPIFAIQGQAAYSTTGQARDGALVEMNNLTLGGLPVQEIIPIATFIYQTNTGYANAVKARIRSTDTGATFVDWRTAHYSPGSGISVSDHGTLSGLADDDHLQYYNAARLLTVTRGLSAAASEADNRIETYAHSVSAASREADNRQNEYLLTAVQPLSAAVAEQNNRQDEYYNTYIHSVSAASKEADNRIEEYVLTVAQPSGAVVEQNNRQDEYNQIEFDDLRHRLLLHEVSAAEVFGDIQYDVLYLADDLRNQILTVQTSASYVLINGSRHITGSQSISGDCLIGDDCFVAGMVHIGPSGSFEYGVGPSGSQQPQGSAPLGYNGEFYATKVFNAIWQDIADFQKVEGRVEFGRAYYMTETGVRLCNERCQLGLAGICSDTYGYGIGMARGRTPIAVAGWVLAYVDRVYTPGTPLTNDGFGGLTEMTFEEKRLYPERIIATYHRPETEEYYEKVEVKGRHWVKVG